MIVNKDNVECLLDVSAMYTANGYKEFGGTLILRGGNVVMWLELEFKISKYGLN